MGGGTPGAINTEQRDDIHKCDDVKPSVQLSVNKTGDNQFQLVATVSQGSHALSSGEFPGTLSFTVDGNEVNSQQIGGPGTYTHTLNDGAAGTKQVTATIVDSVLYDNSSSGTYSVLAASTDGFVLSSSVSGATRTFSWSGAASGTVRVYRSSGGGPICTSSGSSGSCDAAVALPGPFYARDSEDEESNQVSGP